MRLAKASKINERSENYKFMIHTLDNDVEKLFQAMQGRLEFGDGTDGARGVNIAGRFQTFTTSATPDAENTVAHGIGAVPPELYIVMAQDKAGSLYLSGTAWTSTNAYFKCNVASVTFTVFILP